MEKSFEETLAELRNEPSVCAVLLSTLVKRSPAEPEEIMIVSVVGYCDSAAIAKAYCDHENKIYQPSKGGVNPYSWQILQKL